MKQIGKEVCFLRTGVKNPRNGESSFLRLRDGRIMCIYTKYYGDDWTDHAIARLEAVYSADEGETWSESSILIEKDENALNLMAASLIRLADGDLGVLYLRKSMKDKKLLCMPYFVRSSDEGKTFSEPICCIEKEGYYCINNDRLIRLKNGRLIFPVAYHGESGRRLKAGSLTVCYSDDDGRSFHQIDGFVHSPYNDDTQLQEPGLYELSDGRVWMFCRTAYGHQYQCFSTDGGMSFGEVMPAFRFTSPDSPMQVRDVHDRTVAIFNPIGYHCLREDVEDWKSPKRTPFVLAVSDDGGLSFVDMTRLFRDGGYLPFSKKCLLLEGDPENSYCYPAIIETKDGFLVAYYHSDNTPICLNATKILKVTMDELDCVNEKQ